MHEIVVLFLCSSKDKSGGEKVTALFCIEKFVYRGSVAQWLERSPVTGEVAGSSPVGSARIFQINYSTLRHLPIRAAR